ncbi:MAG: hypothetical protein QM642_02705 [Edaphocola sp.]
MKKLTIAVFCMLTFGVAANAQEQEVVPAKTELSAEDKAAAKEAKLQKEKEEYAKAGFTDAEVESVKAILKEADGKTRAVKRDKDIAEDEKKEKLKAISAEKKEKLIGAVGATKYEAWSALRRKK